jgi:hypothetical protein
MRSARENADGYRNELVPGLKATADAERLADELAFAAARLAELVADPPSLYAEIAAQPDGEARRQRGSPFYPSDVLDFPDPGGRPDLPDGVAHSHGDAGRRATVGDLASRSLPPLL